MRDQELRAHLKRIGTTEALARLDYLNHLDAAASSREWKNGRRPGSPTPEYFHTRNTDDEEDDDE